MSSPGGAPGDEAAPRGVDRLTIGLIGEAAEAITKIQSRTGLKKVDVINRAVVIYEFLDAELRQGKELVLRAEDRTEERIKIVYF